MGAPPKTGPDVAGAGARFAAWAPALLRARVVRRGLYVAGAVVFLAIFLKSVRGTLDKNDGYDYFVAARAVWAGEDPRPPMLEEVGYITYPPFNAILFAPLAALGPVGFAVAWNGVNAALVVVIPALALGTLTGRVRGHPLWWYLLPALVAFRVLETNATLSQINLFIGFWCLLALYLIRRGRVAWAGLALGLAAAIKVTPGLFGVYFLWRRRWAAAAWTAVGGVLCIGLVPTVVYGPAHVVDHYRTWRHYASDLVNPQNKPFNYMHGQSVQSALLRLLTKSNARKPGKGPFYVNVLELDPAAVKRAVPVVSVAVLAGLLAVCRNPTAPRDAPGPYLEMALVTVAMLLMSPYVRKAHYASLYPAVSLAVVALLRGDLPPQAARYLQWSLILFAVLLNGTAPAVVTKTGSEFFNGICIFLWATLPFGAALAAACVACARRAPP